MDNVLFNHDESGDTPSEGHKGSGVRRVHNMPLVNVGSVLVVFLILGAMVAFDRAGKKADPGVETSIGEESLADQVLRTSGDRQGGLVADSVPAAPSLPAARVENPDLPPVPDGGQPQEHE